MELTHFLNELALSWPRIAAGAWMTVKVSLFSIFFGTLVGTLLGLAMQYGKLPVRIIGWAYLDFIRGTPVLVLVLASYYVFPLIGFSMGAIGAGVLALAVFCSAHVAEVIRGSLSSIAPGQVEAGKSIGLTFPKILRYVLLPQALRQAIPPWVNTAVEIVKASTLLAVIGVPELLLSTQQIVSRNFLNIEFYAVAAAVYLCINYGLSKISKVIERRVAF